MGASTEENTAAEMVTCDQCGKMVAEMSLAVHRARACRGVARSSTLEDDTENENNTENDDDVIDLCDSPGSRKRHDDAPSSPPPRRRQRRGLPKRDDADAMDIDSDNGNDDEVEVLEPAQNNNTNNNSNSSAEVVDLFSEEDDEWACPRCTLLNDNSKSICEACACRNTAFSSNNSSDDIRPADPVRRERLIDDGYGFGAGNTVNSPLSTIGGGAILGGIMGATGAYMRGRPISSGILEGGVTGAVGGALLNEFNRTPERNRQPQQHYASPEVEDLSRARSAGANGLPAYPVMARGSSRHSTRQPRASFRVASVESPEGYRTTIVTTSGGDGRTRIIRRSQNDGRDSFRSLMLHSMMGDMGGMGRPGMNGGNIDNMSYEQLLAAFGDGSENLGASALDISALPVAKVATKPDGTIDLPAEARECSICLENFEVGQQRKTLPCLHGFHCECVDKWLNTNGACPVCKFRVDQRGSS